MSTQPAAISSFLANACCDGSTRKLIARWWYSILTLSLFSVMMSGWSAYSRNMDESILATWSAILVVFLGIGGTMVMRKYHTGLLVGAFMGSLVGISQFFFTIFLIYIGHARDRKNNGLGNSEEKIQATFALFEAILIGSFAAMLALHRSQVIDQTNDVLKYETESVVSSDSYEAPNLS